MSLPKVDIEADDSGQYGINLSGYIDDLGSGVEDYILTTHTQMHQEFDFKLPMDMLQHFIQSAIQDELKTIRTILRHV